MDPLEPVFRIIYTWNFRRGNRVFAYLFSPDRRTARWNKPEYDSELCSRAVIFVKFWDILRSLLGSLHSDLRYCMICLRSPSFLAFRIHGFSNQLVIAYINALLLHSISSDFTWEITQPFLKQGWAAFVHCLLSRWFLHKSLSIPLRAPGIWQRQRLRRQKNWCNSNTHRSLGGSLSRFRLSPIVQSSPSGRC